MEKNVEALGVSDGFRPAGLQPEAVQPKELKEYINIKVRLHSLALKMDTLFF